MLSNSLIRGRFFITRSKKEARNGTILCPISVCSRFKVLDPRSQVPVDIHLRTRYQGTIKGLCMAIALLVIFHCIEALDSESIALETENFGSKLSSVFGYGV